MFLSEKSFEAAAAEAEGAVGEGAAAGEGAGKREAAYCQTCKKNIGFPRVSVGFMDYTVSFAGFSLIIA